MTQRHYEILMQDKTTMSYIENWLQKYTTEVIVDVLNNKLDDILSDHTSLVMLKMLYENETKEAESFKRELQIMMCDSSDGKIIEKDYKMSRDYRSNGIRETLYELYIR